MRNPNLGLLITFKCSQRHFVSEFEANMLDSKLLGSLILAKFLL